MKSRDQLLEILDTLLTGNCFLWSLTCAGVSFGSLTTARQSNSVSDPPVTTNVTQATDVLLNLSSKGTLYGVVAFKDCGDSADLLIRQIAGTLVLINSGFVTKVPSSLIPDSV